MPVILRVNGIDFFFYSNEHRPIHVHVRKAEATAKVMIEGKVQVVDSKKFSASDLKKIQKFCEQNREIIIEAWEDYFDV